jgi:hypothetical protein
MNAIPRPRGMPWAADSGKRRTRWTRDRCETDARRGECASSILVHRVSLRDPARRERSGHVGKARVYSKSDLEAHEALRNYRISIGLDPEIPSGPNPMFSTMGEWIDGLAAYQMFITCTFRPIRRRWGNPRGFAALENTVKNPRIVSGFRTHRSTDFQSSLASRSPSLQYVTGFYERFICSLQRDLRCHLSYFVGFESGVASGMNHFHAFVSLARADAPFDFWRKGIWAWLHRHAGRSLVLPFEKDRGAGWYLAAAYVGKRPLGWDVHIHGRTHRARRPKPGGHALSVVPSAFCGRDHFHLSLPRWHR